jgi:hypothetical protein
LKKNASVASTKDDGAKADTKATDAKLSDTKNVDSTASTEAPPPIQAANRMIQPVQEAAPSAKKSRKTVVRRLATGQTIAITPQDDKVLHHAYAYMMGFVKRMQIIAQIDKKKEGKDVFM